MSHHPYSPDTSLMAPASGPERLLAVVSHSAIFWGPLLVPLAVLLLRPLITPDSYYVRHQSMQALLWHLFAWIIGGALWGVAWGLMIIPILGWIAGALLMIPAGLFTIWTLWIALVATIRGFQGRPYQLPIVGNIGR